MVNSQYLVMFSLRCLSHCNSSKSENAECTTHKPRPHTLLPAPSGTRGGGRVVRWSWINFQVRGVLLVWIRVGQGPTALAVGAGGGCLDIFTLIYPFCFLSPSLWETTRYRLKYCLKGSLSPKTTNQPAHVARSLQCRVLSVRQEKCDGHAFFKF